MMVTGVLVSLKAAWGETSSIQLDHGACVLVCVHKRISFWLSRSSWVLYGTCTYFWSCHPFPKPPTSLSKTPRCKPTVSNTLAGKHTHTLTSKCKEANSFFFLFRSWIPSYSCAHTASVSKFLSVYQRQRPKTPTVSDDVVRNLQGQILKPNTDTFKECIFPGFNLN